MFKKLVSNLSFSPGVASQLTFYAKRLRAEKFTRTLSLLLGAGVFALQFATIVAPPTAVSASPNNDILPGGATTQQNLADTCDGNLYLQTVYGHFGITCANIRGGTYDANWPVSNSTWLSLGKEQHASTDTLVRIGDNNFYLRPLSSVAISATGRAVTGTSSWGHPFAVLLSCGNPVVPSIPSPPVATPPPVLPPVVQPPTLPPVTPSSPPSLTLHKAVASSYPAEGSSVAPGTSLGYQINVANVGGSPAVSDTIKDTIPVNTTFVSQSSSGLTNEDFQTGSQPYQEWHWNTLSPSQSAAVMLIVKVNADAPDGAQICNSASIISNNVGQVNSNTICHIVKRSVTPPPPVPNITQSKFATFLAHAGLTTPALINAQSPKANAGDVIEYTLKTSNTGNGAQANYQVVESLPDVLEYADVTNYGGGSLQGTSLVWPAVTIPARSDVTKTFQITVKSPVPSTARSSSDIFSYDLCMDNVYGDTVHICVTPPPAKQVEVVSESLPQTGPGAGIGLVAGFVALLAYFYARNRQLQREVSILRVDHNPGVA